MKFKPGQLIQYLAIFEDVFCYTYAILAEKENTAYHEAGHAILNVLLEHTDPLHKVTIIPRGPALGVTMFLPEEDKYTQRKFEMLDHLVVAMGGRVAEEIVFGDVTVKMDQIKKFTT